MSIDIGESFFDLIASNASLSAGHRFVRSPSLFRYRSRSWDYGLPLKPVDVIQEPVLFGAVDGVARTVDDAGVLKNYALGVGEVATRSIDSWASARGRICLIHFGDVVQIGDQIRGAAKTLARDRPIVTLYPPAGQCADDVLSSLKNLGYLTIELTNVPAHPEAGGRSLEFGWIMVPAEKYLATPPASLAEASMEDSSSPGRGLLDYHAPKRHRSSSRVFGLSKVAPPELNRSVSIEDVIVCNDCYPVERDGQSCWRWLGPRSRSRLAIPCAFPGGYRFEASVLSYRCPDGLGACRILVEGREVPTTVRGLDKGQVEFFGHLDSLGYKGYVEIDFIAPGSPSPVNSDPRTLRLNLSSISVSSCH